MEERQERRDGKIIEKDIEKEMREECYCFSCTSRCKRWFKTST